MMDSYGLPYQGSKNKIAEFIISNLPRAEHFYDLFAGGCAVTHCALLSGKYNYVHANDIQIKYPQLFYDAAHGKYRNENRVITRDEFFMFKDSDAFVELCWSFGNGRTKYLWNRNIEEVKQAACRMIMCDDMINRRLYFYEFIKKLKSIMCVDENDKLIRLKTLESLERLQSLLCLERIQGLDCLLEMHILEGLDISGKSYNEVEILPNSVVYCDPPYIGTGGYCVEFDHEQFYEWLRNTNFPVYISEYTMPSDFAIVASIDNISNFSPTNNSTVKQENIYIHERFFKSRKEQLKLF